jgi:hypothetical protein
VNAGLAPRISGTFNGLERDLREVQQALKPPKKCLWPYLLRSNNHWGTIGGSLSVTGTPFGMRKMGSALAHCTTDT